MSKKLNRVFFKKLTFEKLYEAYLRAKKNKGPRFEILKFSEKLEVNLSKLYYELKTGQYKVGAYRSFTIYEPKERLIKALPFRDRVVHQWYVYEFVIPHIVPRFIAQSYACIPTKGTHKASLKVTHYMKKCTKKYGDFYILKMDIKKYFYSINKNILFNLMKQYFKDKLLLKLTYTLIHDTDDPISIPIGNYTSQYFANIYLGELDKYLKYNLKIKYYVRYMDDFIIMVKDKKTARTLYEKIEQFLENKLNLELNSKSRIYPSKMGVDFCGYRVFKHYKLIRKRSIKKVKKDIKTWKKDSNLNLEKVYSSYQSWVAHIKHANSYNLLTKCNAQVEQIVLKHLFFTLPIDTVIKLIEDLYFMSEKINNFVNELTIIEN